MAFASTHRSRVHLWWAAPLLALAAAASGDVVINEFMASNGSTRTNALGETSDWIELYNPGDTTVDLTGWHLTDRRDDLTKWTFPSTNLPPASYLLIEASGRATPIIGTELHADIKLDADGEYLGLIHPDGLTVAAEYAPQFPAQATDVSFGLRPDTATIPLLASQATCRYQVPIDGSDGTNWTTRAFNDGVWAQGQMGIGYESAPGDFAAWIQTALPQLTPAAYVRCPFNVDNPALLDALLLRVKFDDGFVAYLNGTRIASANDPAGLSWTSMATLEQSNDLAVVYQDFDVSAYRSALVAGTNVLAIHLLNRSVNPRVPNDLLLVPELSAQIFTPSPSGEWRYFHEPTPGARNTLGSQDVAQPVTFSEPHGFRTAPFALSLATATAGAGIYYTLDSSVPTTNAGIRYTGPIAVTRTTVVRARAFKPNEEPSAVNTRTYLFAADIIASPAMRTTITQDPVYGPRMTNALLALPTLSVATTTTGIDYSPELPASLELIWPNGREGFQINAGIARFGNYWQNFEKRMFRLFFRQQYGAGKLRYPLFDGFERGIEPVQEFDQLDLKSGSQDMARYGFYMAESFCDDAMLEMGHLNPHGFFVHVYLNGQYWGIYHLHERWKANTLAAYVGGEPEDYQADDSEGTSENWQDQPVHPVDGDGSVWTRLTVQRANYQVQRTYLDVPQFLDFMLLWFMGGCEGEFRGTGPIAANAGGYKMWMKDTDGWMRGMYHPLTNPGPGALLSGLRTEAHPDYLMVERDHIYRNFFGDGPLTPARNRARLTRRCDELEPAFPAESARWGYRTPDTWATEKAAALIRFDSLTAQLLGNLRAAGWYPQDAPEFSPGGGVFTGAITVAIQVTNGVPIYYTLNGEDPRQAGSGAAAGSLYSAPLTLTRTTTLKARARNGTTWGALQEALYSPAAASPLRLTELMVQPREPDANETNAGANAWTATDFEYVELRNTGADTIGLAGVRFTDGIRFEFSAGSVATLAPGAYVLVVKNRAAFAARYPTVPASRIAGEFAAVDNWPVQTLNDGGERLQIVDGIDRTIVSVSYGNGRSWPLAACGAGHSLVPLALDNQSDALEYGGNWRASAFRDGSPGTTDPTPIRDVVVNEVVTHTDYSNAAIPEYDSNDAIELYNTTAATIPFGDWYLSDRADALKLWRIPATNAIAAAHWIVFDEVHDFHQPITNGFGLNKAGDQVFLSYLPGDARDRVADAVRVDGQENGQSWGRSPDGADAWYALPPTPDAPNAEPATNVVISEFMFHPPDTNGADNAAAEFVELYNPLAVTAALWTADGPWSLRGDVDWTFAAGTSLAPGERLAIVPFDPASNTAARTAFLDAYGLTNGQVRLLGPFSGPLDNRGARLALSKPLAPDLPGDPLVWVAVDDMTYFDRTPWPDGADGTGRALARVASSRPARDPANWYAAAPTPGLPPERIALATPEPGDVVFTPGPFLMNAVVDESSSAGVTERVDFYQDDQLLGSRDAPPYAYVWTVPAPGRVALRAERTDAGGVWTSRLVQVSALAVSTAAVTTVTDTDAAFQAELAGDLAAEVRMYWGETDGGTEPTAWESSALAGTVSNAAFVVHVANLPPNRTFYVRAGARIGSTLGWSPASITFRTPGYEQWPYTTRIRLSGYTESTALQNFPALILLGPHLAGFDYAQFGGNRASLRFTDEAGLQRLRYEVDTWDTNGTSAVWVQIPTLVTGTTIRAYWGLDAMTNPPAEAQEGGVWEDAYEAVWHLGASLANAAEPGRAATNDGALPTAGIVGTASAFNGAQASIDPMVPASWYNDHLAAQTWSLWVQPSATVTYGATVFGAEGTSNRLYLAMNTSARVLKWVYGAGAAELQGSPYALGAWQMLSMVLSNGTLFAQLNDGPLAALGACPSFTATNQPLLGRRGGGTSPFAGTIDEVRLAPVARPGAWLRSEYRTVAAPLSFAVADPVRLVNALDADDDGLPDDWERIHFGGTALDGSDDTDGDGMTDAGEFTSGTDPQDPASVFLLEVLPAAPDPAVGIPMRSAQGTGYTDRVRYYDLLTAPGLEAAAWAPVPDFTNILGEDLLLIHTNPAGATGSHYYRTRVRLEPATP